MDSIIVSRHPAAIRFIAEKIASETHRRVGTITEGYVCLTYWEDPMDPRDQASSYESGELPPPPEDYIIEVVAVATGAHVFRRYVYGNLPLHLAALAERVYAIEFEGTPPRGQEYTLEEMRAAGARLRPYKVQAVKE